MSDALTLPAEVREKAGKGASRALRRAGRVPAVIYGGKEEPQSIHVEEKELARQLGTGHFANSIVMVEIGGKSVRTLPKDVAFHPVSDRPLHVDFLRLSKDAKVEVLVPVVFANEEASPGLKKGGTLNVVRHEVELACPADAIPEELVFDLTGLEIGDTIRIGAFDLPKGVTPSVDRDFVVATVAGSAAGASEAAEEAAEGEA